MEKQMRFEVKPPSATSPRPEDTPRTRNLKELRKKRLQFFETKNNNSSSTTDSGATDTNLSNNVQSLHNDLRQQDDVRASMAADARVLALDANRAPSSSMSAMSREVLARDGLLQSNSFYRNQLNSDQMDTNNNSTNARSSVNQATVPSGVGTRSSMSNIAVAARREALMGSQGNQRPVSASTLGFSLPDLPPHESNMVSQPQESRYSIKANNAAKVAKPTRSGMKGNKSVPRPPKKSPTSSRDSLNNMPTQSQNRMSVSGLGIAASSSDTHLQVRNMIEADFEEDYSELGLSVDRQKFDNLRGSDFQIPAFSPSHKPKSRGNSIGSGIRANHGVEQFVGLSVSAVAEDLHERPHVPEKYEFSMRKSATHEGLVTHTKDTNSKLDGRESFELRNEDSLGDSAASESEYFNPSGGSATISSKEERIHDNNRNDVMSNAPKTTMPAKPLNVQSTDFEKSRTQSISESDDTSQSKSMKSALEQEFATDMLQSVLGKDRLDRLLKNLEESAWISEEKSTVARSGLHDVTLESYRSESEVDQSGTSQFPPTDVSQSTDIAALGLTTHRPEQEGLGSVAQESKAAVGSSTDPNSTVLSDSVNASLQKSSIRYSFCSDEIYARARKLSQTSAEEEPGSKGQSAAISSTEQHLANTSQEVMATRSSTLSDFMGNTQNQNSLDEPDTNAKFDYARGIHSVKKEFYKTVAITDSTAVSDNSLSTAKFSKKSIDSPRGQIPSQRPPVHNQRVGHRRTGSVGSAGRLASSSHEEHIEGIRQHVADIRVQQFEEKIRAGMPYTSASIERYFASMETLNIEPLKSFEPIPEPDIPETPRSEKDSVTKEKTIVNVNVDTKSSGKDSAKVISRSRKDNDAKSKNSFGSFLHNSMSQSGDKSNINRVLTGDTTASVAESAFDRLDTTEQSKIENNKLLILNNLLKEDVSEDEDDDMLTRVTSIVGDERMTERLNDFATIPELPERKRNNSVKKSSTSSDMDAISSHSSEDVKSAEPRKNNCVGAKSSKKADMNKKKEKEDEVEILFRASPREQKTKSMDPTPSGVPTASKSSNLQEADIGSFDDPSHNLNSSMSSVSQVKVCPECAEVNKIYVTWCVECGAVLSGVDPVPCKGKRDVTRHLGVSASTNLSVSATNFKNRLEESMYNPSGASLSSAWLQQSQGRLAEESSVQNVNKPRATEAANKDVLSLKLDVGIRDSDEFEYDTEQSPVRSLPKALQSELSLDLSLKAENAENSKRASSSASDKLAELSEAIPFEYTEAESPKKFFPAALQEELNLNLSLDGSQTTASLRGGSLLGGATAGPSWMNKSSSNNNNSHMHMHLEEDRAADSIVDISPKLNNSARVDTAVQANNYHPGAGEAPGNVQDANDQKREEEVDDLVHVDDVDEDTEDEEKIVYEQFVQRLRSDPRLKAGKQGNRPQSAMQPTRSSGRPTSAVAGNRKRPQSAQSKVRASIETPGYQRKWAASSKVAWNALSHGEIRPRSSLRASIEAESQPTSAALKGRPSSATTKRSISKPGPSNDDGPKKSNGIPDVSRRGARKSVNKARSSSANANSTSTEENSRAMAETNVSGSVSGSMNKLGRNKYINTYAKYFEMTPRIAAGEFSQWLCLPDEIWLHICRYLRHRDLARMAQTCMQLHRVALDESLWKTVVVKKNHNMIDEWLTEIGRRQPSSLSLVQCHGEKVTANGLRELFRQCCNSLKELNFTGCSRGEMKGDNILLHAAARCRNITHFDASWSNVNDHGLMALSEASHGLESVCLNGCQVVTDEAIHALVTKHGMSLRTLELFGCFNVSPRSAASIAASCKMLTILNLGQCWKLTDQSIARLAPSLTEVINLDLRGCKQMKDTTIHQLMHYCKKLQSLSIANCPGLTDVSLTEIATYCNGIQSLDLCGCKGITDMGVRALAMACQSLEYLDVSSSAITHKSVSTLASYCHARLEVLKLNFCKHINVPSLVRLAKNCKQLTQLYLYGVDGLRHLEPVCLARPGLCIQT